MTDARIELARLVDVPLDAVVALRGEPRSTRHMPLSTPFTPKTALEWAHAKDAQWTEHGYVPWAVLVDGLTDVLIALPYSRSPDRAVARLGFRPDGDVDYGGVAFRQHRLTRQAWTATRGLA